MDQIKPSKNISLGLKWGWLLWLFLLMNWLRIEDITLFYLNSLGVIVGGLTTLYYFSTRKINPSLRSYLFLGMMAGAFTSFIILSLILFKSSLHSHGFFELPSMQVFQLIFNTGWWIGAGLILSLIFYRFRKEN